MRQVVAKSKGQIIKVSANREVILSAGATGSPQILMLSSIKSGSELGILVDFELRGVGKNFQDHLQARPTFKLTSALSIPKSTTGSSKLKVLQNTQLRERYQWQWQQAWAPVSWKRTPILKRLTFSSICNYSVRIILWREHTHFAHSPHKYFCCALKVLEVSSWSRQIVELIQLYTPTT